MTRLALGAAFTLIVATTSTTHAEVAIPDDVQTAADAAGVDPLDLLGAVNTTHMEPRTYLCASDGLLCPPKPPAVSATSPRVACIIRVESRGDPSATNARSKAAGLGQFLPSTWATTPQGKAGLSPYDATANRAAIDWMVNNGRAREFDAVRYYGC